MGLYNERRRYAQDVFTLLTYRFNVAITRAKELLIVIGNANLLKVDSDVEC